MKKIIIALLIPIAGLAQADKGFTIKGQVKGLKDSTLVYLVNGSNGNPIAQTYSYNGAFNLTGKVEQEDIYQISFIGYPDVYETYLGNENITLSGNTTGLKTLAVTGSPTALDYQLYLKRFNPLKDKLNKNVSLANQTQEAKKRDSLVSIINKTVADIQTQIDLFVKERPSSPVTTFILYVTNQLNNDPSILEQRYSKLTDKAKNNVYSKAIDQMMAANSFGSIGSLAPDFVQNDPNGKPVALSSFRGKYVLIDFWASWCGPCRRENPNVVAAYNEYKNKNFTIVGVSLDQDKQKWLDAIKNDNLSWTHVSDLAYWSNAVAKQYQVSSIPQNFLIDPSGKIIAKNLRGEELKEALSHLLK